MASLTSGSRSAGRGSPTPNILSLVTKMDNSSSESFSIFRSHNFGVTFSIIASPSLIPPK